MITRLLDWLACFCGFHDPWVECGRRTARWTVESR